MTIPISQRRDSLSKTLLNPLIGRSGDVQISTKSFADDLTRRGVLGQGAGVDRCAQLWVDAHGYDFSRPRTNHRTTAPARLQRVDVVARVLDLIGDRVEVAVSQQTACRAGRLPQRSIGTTWSKRA